MYSNGFDTEKVLPALAARLGWSDSSLSAANTASASGRLFDDGSFHPLVTVAGVKAAAEKPADWNAWFESREKAVILRCLNAVFSEPEFIEQADLYQPCTEQVQEVTGSGQFVGYRIEVAPGGDKTVQVNSAELYFTASATFSLYLFKAGSLVPVKTLEVTSEAGGKLVVPLDGWHLNARQSRVWYLGYFQADTGEAKAIMEADVYWSRTLCFGGSPILANATGATTFDRVSHSYTGQPYGLNLNMSTIRDHTQAIASQPHLFDELIGLAMAVAMLELMANTTNYSGMANENKVLAGRILFALSGGQLTEGGPFVPGLLSRYAKEVKRVREAFNPKPKAQSVSLC